MGILLSWIGESVPVSIPQLLMLEFMLLYVSNTFLLLFLRGTEGVSGHVK